MLFIIFRAKILAIVCLVFFQACSLERSNSEIDSSSMKEKKNERYLHDEIILYMTDAEDSGQIVTDKKNAKYFRKIIKQELDIHYLVQDFYISGNKLTSPYWLIDGQKKYVFNESNHQNYYPREGERILWYESGKKMAVTNYKNKTENGLWKTWHENGNLKEEMRYKYGQLDGLVKHWNIDGVLIGECLYALGKENGRCYEKYTINPKLFIYDGYYKNGKKTGIWREWDSNGYLINSKNFD